MHPKSFVGRALPGPTGGAYSAPPDPLAGFKWPTSKEGEGRDKEGRGGKGRGWMGEGRRSGLPRTHTFWLRGYATDTDPWLLWNTTKKSAPLIRSPHSDPLPNGLPLALIDDNPLLSCLLEDVGQNSYS